MSHNIFRLTRYIISDNIPALNEGPSALTAKALFENRRDCSHLSPSNFIVSQSLNQGKDTMSNTGELRGLEIAAKARITQQGDRWFVPSQSGKSGPIRRRS
jgi:hypothetical protein